MVVSRSVLRGELVTRIENDNGYLSAGCNNCQAPFEDNPKMDDLGIVAIAAISDENGARTQLENLPGNARADYEESGFWAFSALDDRSTAEIPKGAKWLMGCDHFKSEFASCEFFALEKDDGTFGRMYSESGYEIIAFWSDLESITETENSSPVPVRKVVLTSKNLKLVEEQFSLFVVNPNAEDFQRFVPRSYVEKMLQ